MDNLVEILVPLGVAVALPVCIVSIIFRSAMAADRNRKEIVLAALEKNPALCPIRWASLPTALGKFAHPYGQSCPTPWADTNALC